MMVSIMAFDKSCNGAKTLGWDTQRILKMISKTLEWEAIPLKNFKKMSFKNDIGDEYSRSWRQEFPLKRTLVIVYSPRAIELCNHITLVWDMA
jgi:hypothetical protein